MPEARLSTNIRLAALDQANAIAAVLLESFAEFRPLYTSEAFAVTTPTAEKIQQRWAEGPVWVARHAGEIVGTVAAVPRASGLYIRSMAVHPSARGLGLGRLLLAQIEASPQARSFPRLYLSTTPFLHSAIRLYENGGFARTDEGPTDLHGTPLVTMAKALHS